MTASSPNDIWALAEQRLQAGGPFCLVTVVRSASPDLPPGTKGLFTEQGLVAGPDRLGADRSLARAVAETLARRGKQLAPLDDGGEAFLDSLCSQPRLLICGAGHIAIPLARYGCDLGFDVTVLDDRADYARSDRFPGCSVLAEEFAPAISALELGDDDFAVIITRGHEHDVDCLTQLLTRPLRYVGMIGSRRRVRFVLEQLERQGHAREPLEAVFSPIGLPIGAESPEEIALTIAAELVCVRRKGAAQARALREATQKAQGGTP